MGSLLSVLDDVTVPHSMMSYLGGNIHVKQHYRARRHFIRLEPENYSNQSNLFQQIAT